MKISSASSNFDQSKVLPASMAVPLVFSLYEDIAPWADGENVFITIDANCGYSFGQTVCRGEQQIKDDVGKSWFYWIVHPFLIIKIQIIFLRNSIDLMQISSDF